MNQDQNIHELIDQYLQGKLVGENLDLFRIRLRDDKSFLHQVQLQKALIQHIEKSREAELKALFKSKKERSALIIRINKRILSVAAVILAITAMAMVLKMYLPSQKLAKDSADDKKIESTSGFDDSQTQVEETEIHNGEKSVAENDLLGQGDEENEKSSQVLVENHNQTGEKDAVLVDETDDLTELRTAENQLDAKNIKAAKDELLSSKKHTILALVRATQFTSTGTTNVRTNEVVATESMEKNKSAKKEGDAELDDQESIDSNTLIQTVGKTITLEYWKSIVNFKGYNYDGNVLMLYDVSPDSKVQVVTFDGKTYMKWGGAVYRMLNNSKYESFSRVTNPEMLNLINK